MVLKTNMIFFPVKENRSHYFNSFIWINKYVTYKHKKITQIVLKTGGK